MAGRYFFVFYSFCHWAYFISKKLLQNFGSLYLGQKTLEKLHLHPKWGLDTHNSPHQRGASSKAEQPLIVQKKPFQKLSKVSQSLIILNIQSLPYSQIIIFDEVKHFITDFTTFVEYFSPSNRNTDKQVITLCLMTYFDSTSGIARLRTRTRTRQRPSESFMLTV